MEFFNTFIEFFLKLHEYSVLYVYFVQIYGQCDLCLFISVVIVIRSSLNIEFFICHQIDQIAICTLKS